MTQIIHSIIEMGIKWVAQMAMMLARWIITQLTMTSVKAATNATSAATGAATAITTATATGAALAAIWAAPATLATIASFGAAADAAPGEIALAEGATQGIAALAGGGPVSAGTPYIVGDGGVPELFVPRESGYVHPSVSKGLSAMRGATAGAGSDSQEGDTHVHVWGIEDSMRSYIRSHPDAQHDIVKMIANNTHKILPRRA